MHSTRFFLLFILMSLFFVGCSGGDATLATLVPTVAARAGDLEAAADESPRAAEEGPSSNIPPTWTPGPSAEEIPAQQPAFPTRRPDETYIVQPGDTLAEIAEAFGVDLQRLASANDIVNVDFIFTGQVLTIPR